MNPDGYELAAAEVEDSNDPELSNQEVNIVNRKKKDKPPLSALSPLSVQSAQLEVCRWRHEVLCWGHLSFANAKGLYNTVCGLSNGTPWSNIMTML